MNIDQTTLSPLAYRLRGQLGNADVTRVSTGAFAIINALQNHSTEEHGVPLPGELLGSLATAFILAMEASGLPTGDVCGTARNLMADAVGRRPEFKAITQYIKEEVYKS